MTNFYEVLEIPTDADESIIKRAWARLVRVHTPDKDPEGNRRIGEAKATLLDPRARADHDAQLLFGDDLQALFASAHESMEDEEFEDAIAAYKEILALHPSSLDARNQLALAYTYLEKYSDAVKQFTLLVKAAPDSALYAANMAEAFSRWSQSDETKWDEAEKWFLAATKLESYNSAHYLRLSELYRERNLYDKAEWAIESAIAADGKTDLDDLDSMMELTWIYLFSGQEGRIKEVAVRIKEILPDEQDARDYAVYLFLRVAGALGYEYLKFQTANIFVSAARLITPVFGELENLAEDIETKAKVEIEVNQLLDDKSIEPSIVPMILALTISGRLGHEIEEHIYEDYAKVTSTWSRTEIRRAMDTCRKRYPVATEFVADVIPTIIDFGVVTSGSPVTNGRSSGSSGSGCAVIIVIAVIIGIFRAASGSSSSSPSPSPSSDVTQPAVTSSYGAEQSITQEHSSSQENDTQSESQTASVPTGWKRETVFGHSMISPVGWKREESESGGQQVTKWTNPEDGASVTVFESQNVGDPIDKPYDEESVRFSNDPNYKYELVRVRKGSDAFHNGLIWNFKLSRNRQPLRSRMIAYFDLGSKSYAISLSYLADQPGRPYQTFFDPLFDEITSWN